MFKIRTLVTFAILLLCPILAMADSKVANQAATGAPNNLTGDLGMIDALSGPQTRAQDETLFHLSAQNTLQGILVEHFGASGSEEMEVIRVREDALGNVHVRFQQHLNGLPVIGAQMYLHARVATGEVYAVNGTFAPSHDVPFPAMAKGSAGQAVSKLARQGVAGRSMTRPELIYFHDAEMGSTHLSWKVTVKGEDNGMFFDNDVYVDAFTYEVVAVAANVHTAKSLQTYDAPEYKAVYDPWNDGCVRKGGDLQISIDGCDYYPGMGFAECYATGSGGSGAYNYWWMYEGNGHLYQSNSASATISGCWGTGTLTVQILDLGAPSETCRTYDYEVNCGNCWPFCDQEVPEEF